MAEARGATAAGALGADDALAGLDLARRLLHQEAGAGREAAGLALAAERACERLRRRLGPLIGLLGFTALIGRALHLAQDGSPALSALAVDARADVCLGGARAFAAAHAAAPDLVEAGFVAILAHFIALLALLIGADLTWRVLGALPPARGNGTETAA